MKYIHLIMRKQKGMTLVEMMVAMVVGLLILLAATQLVSSNRATFRTRDDAGRINENALFALDLMTRHLRLAGHVPDNFFSRIIFDGGTTPVITNCASDTAHAICGANDSGVNTSDVLQVRFRGKSVLQTLPIPTPGAVADNGVVACDGSVINGDTMVEERFMIQAGANGQFDLVCHVITGEAAIRGAAPPPAAPGAGVAVVIADNVRSMQVLFGRSNDPARARADSWTVATPANPGDVVAARVSLLLEGVSATGGTPVAQSTTFRFFGQEYAGAGDAGATYISPTDTRLRKLASTTVGLRNRQ